ncbi:MAG: NAD+ synthase [Actinomycetia bacterium]|nr:NAD+ synthase [Actinomycetes bacterium]
MAPIRLALAQINPTVGDLAGNSALILAQCRAAAEAGADVALLPEMALTGYPIEDLALRDSFIEASRDAGLALAAALMTNGLGELTVVFGLLDRAAETQPGLGSPRNAPTNAVWVLHGGEIIAQYRKHHLPNYGVFDEYRYFVPGDQPGIIEVAGRTIALAVCEDLWQSGGPVDWARQAGAELLLVLNGSPYEQAKDDVRLELCQQRAAEAGCAVAYANLFGGQDELVFDGDSLVVSANGTLIARSPRFQPDLLIVDMPESGPPVAITPIPAPLDTEAEIWAALVLGLRDYVRKNGFTSVVLGLSGGIDSAVVAALACDALGPDHVHAVSLPSSYSSQHSQDDAALLAERTDLQFRTVPIADMVAAFQNSLGLTGLAEENLQARVRGVTLMGISNQEGHLVLATGNKTELSVGYSTIYGDAVGGFAPIKDIPKTLVWGLARWRNEQARRENQPEPIPQSSIDKPPSAELRPDQLDSDSLPDYAVLDDILDDYVEQDRGVAELVAQGFDAALVRDVVRMTDAAEYKRRQYPPGPKVSLRAFGRDRRLPITNRWREATSDQ